ncbi:MAG: Sodium Bile acid symporter family protein [Syntrophaceae bacterium PtaU1.Bin231]|nr:MAG: Sodium Bile acid symporter family protein [Syntrophaceae bacterium PtaU1.Bin231]
MNEFLSHALTPVILIYVVSGMLALGLSQTVRQIIEPLKNVRITISAIVASYILLPLLATSIARLFGFDPPLRYGLVLLSMAAGAEVGPIFTAKSNANVSLAGGILAMSIAITIIYIPLMLGVFLPDVDVDVKHLVLKLLLTIVAPLLLGLLIRSRFEKMAHTAEKYLHLISRLFVVLLLLTLFGLYYKPFIRLFGTYTLLAGVIYVIAAFGIGYLLGWPERGSMLAMGYMHGARNASVAVIAATSAFSDQPNVMMMIATMVILMLAILIPVSSFFKIKPGPVETSK